MQGLWKDKRKHFLKDKDVYVKKAIWKESVAKKVYFVEGKSIIQMSQAARFGRPIVESLDIWKVLNINTGIKTKAYSIRPNVWLPLDIPFDVYFRNYDDQFIPLSFVGKGSPEWLKEKNIKLLKIREFSIFNSGRKFLYGKPLVKTNYKYSKKWARKTVLKSNRVKLRNWISKFSIENEESRPIPEHNCTKSVSWMVI